MDRLDMRVSDAERQDVAESLRQALSEGRLDLDEYDERVQQAYQAKTYRELAAPTADLPDAKAPAPTEHRHGSVPARPDTALHPRPNGAAIVAVLGVAIGLVVVASLVTGGLIVPLWPLFIFAFWRLSHRRC